MKRQKSNAQIKHSIHKVSAIILTLFMSLQLSGIAFAETVTALPTQPEGGCDTYAPYTSIEEKFDRNNIPDGGEYDPNLRVEAKNEFVNNYTRDEQYEVIACALKSGQFHLFMVPYMIRYFIELIIALAGIICTLFIVIGAYQYMIGAVTENKQKGKETIQNALIGLTITLLSWIIVNIVQVALTGGGPT